VRVHAISLLADNYAWLLQFRDGTAAVIDPSEASPVQQAIAACGVTLSHILATHHHWDHVGGIDALAGTDVPVLGSAHDLAAGRIPKQTRGLSDGDTVVIGDLPFAVLAVPGHTLGAVAYHADGALFTGDTLFLAGCGRLFEGTAAQMWHSLQRLRALPDDTLVYCGHEYTRKNLGFAAEHAQSDAVRTRIAGLASGPTVPATLAVERATNPFLRADDPALAHALGTAPGLETFTELRRRRDAF
jgi:hydroxyacylglutathione hydrolase